jgi:hypothetical protein
MHHHGLAMGLWVVELPLFGSSMDRAQQTPPLGRMHIIRAGESICRISPPLSDNPWEASLTKCD